ncbi:MAG: hypothetical protein UIQ97_03630 [Eggerthellaceae bacterium]
MLFASYAYIIAAADTLPRRLVHLLDHFPCDKAAGVKPQGDAELQELIDSHLSLPVENVPESFGIKLNTTSEFRNTDSPLLLSQRKFAVNSYRSILMHGKAQAPP